MIEDPKQDVGGAPADDLAFPLPEQPPMDDDAGGPTADADDDRATDEAELPPGKVADVLGDFA